MLPKLRFNSLFSHPFRSEGIKISSVVFVSQLLDEEWAVPAVPHRSGTGYSSRIGGWISSSFHCSFKVCFLWKKSSLSQYTTRLQTFSFPWKRSSSSQEENPAGSWGSTTTSRRGFCLRGGRGLWGFLTLLQSWAAAHTGSTKSSAGPREPATPPLWSFHLSRHEKLMDSSVYGAFGACLTSVWQRKEHGEECVCFTYGWGMAGGAGQHLCSVAWCAGHRRTCQGTPDTLQWWSSGSKGGELSCICFTSFLTIYRHPTFLYRYKTQHTLKSSSCVFLAL